MYGALSYVSYGNRTNRMKEVLGQVKTLKSSIGVASQKKGVAFTGKEGGFSSCNNAVLKLYCKSYWILYKRTHTIILFIIFLLFFLFCIY